MIVNWAKNMSGYFKLTDEEMADIPQPLLELGIHITAKTVQVGCLASTINTVLLVPVLNQLRGKQSFVNTLKTRRMGLIGLGVGAVMGPVLTLVRVNAGEGIPEEGLYDRAYRIRHNQGQLMVDRTTAVTAVLGGALGGLRGIVWGMSAGVLLDTVYKQVNPLPAKPKKEKKEGEGGEKQEETAVKKVGEEMEKKKEAVVEMVKAKLPKRKERVEEKKPEVHGTESCKCGCHDVRIRNDPNCNCGCHFYGAH